MTIETVTCGRCGDRVSLDVDHGEVRLDTIHMDARDGALAIDVAGERV